MKVEAFNKNPYVISGQYVVKQGKKKLTLPVLEWIR